MPAETEMKLVRTAYVVAFVLAGLSIFSAFLNGPITLLPLSLIPLMAGIGIVRRRVWSAYGFALYGSSGLLLLPVLLFRDGIPPAGLPGIVLGAAFTAALVVLFLFAGRALKAAGSALGRRFPWVALTALCTVPLVFLRAFVIPSGAMEDTLLVGDHILVQRLPKPKLVRDEIVVFAYPLDRREDYVKRIIGVPGDRIHMSNKALYRNGMLLNEPYAVHKFPYFNAYRDNFPREPEPGVLGPGLDMLNHNVVQGEVLVPAGRHFVLGDNRDDSLDSRYWGFITAHDVIGKPLLIYDSEERPTDELPDASSTGLRHRTRWNRIFRLL